MKEREREKESEREGVRDREKDRVKRRGNIGRKRDREGQREIKGTSISA